MFCLMVGVMGFRSAERWLMLSGVYLTQRNTEATQRHTEEVTCVLFSFLPPSGENWGLIPLLGGVARSDGVGSGYTPTDSGSVTQS